MSEARLDRLEEDVREKWPAPMTRIIIAVLALIAAVSACQYPGCVEADRLARQCGGGHCAELEQTQQRACGTFPNSPGSSEASIASEPSALQVLVRSAGRDVAEGCPG